MIVGSSVEWNPYVMEYVVLNAYVPYSMAFLKGFFYVFKSPIYPIQNGKRAIPTIGIWVLCFFH